MIPENTEDTKDLPQRHKGSFQHIVNTYLNGEKLKSFLFKLAIRQNVPLPLYLLSIVHEVLAKAIRQFMEIK